jgi:hypothetical protein
MIEKPVNPRDEPAGTNTLLGDGICCNGVDDSAIKRAHMRELTAARQAAEKRFARPGPGAGADRATKLAAAQERAADLRAELARIDAEHRLWLLNQGEGVPGLRKRRSS